MAEPKIYKTAEDFRKSLEERLKSVAQTKDLELARLRRIVAFERLLARLFQEKNSPWLLKGSYALELRLREKARATRDMDFAFSLPPLVYDQARVHAKREGAEVVEGRQTGNRQGDSTKDEIHSMLTKEALKNLGDWFQFRVEEAKEKIWGAPAGGFRFPVESVLAGREFANFHLDVGLGDVPITEPEWIRGHDLLNFAGIPSVSIALLPREYHFAEKIHAYTRPRSGADNSRVRDLADLVLLIEEGKLVDVKTTQAIQAAFKQYNTHPLPEKLNPPPESWKEPFSQLAQEIDLSQKTVQAAFGKVEKFWNRLSTR